MDKQNIENNLNNEQEIPKYWVDRLSDENKILEKKYSKTHSANIAQPTHIANIADFNEAIRKFASSFLLPKTDVSFYRMMLTYLGTPIGIDIRMSNHPAGKDENWLLTEGNGLANQRLSIYFRGDTNAISKDCDDGVPLIEQGFHYEHLKNEQVLNEIRKSIVGFIKNGSYAEIKQPFIESDADVAERLRKKEIEKNNRKIQRKFVGISPEDVQSTEDNKTDKNESKNMSKKNTIRITESDLKRVISESVKKIVNEGYSSSPYKDYNEIDNIHGRGNDENSRGMLFSKGMQLIYKALNTKKDEWNYAKNDWDRNIPTADKNEEKYFDAINKHLKSIEGIWRLWQKQQTQKTGTLPIDNY